MAVRSYRDLIAWQKGLDLVALTYELTNRFPDDERFGLTAQVRRASVSIVANLAEGWGRGYRREYARFVSQSGGSQKEVEALVLVGDRLNYVAPADLNRWLGSVDEMGRILWTLRKRLAAG